MFSTMVEPIYIPTSSSREFPFPATLSSLVICWLLVDRLIDILRSIRWYLMICIFWCQASFHVPIDHLYIFFVYLFFNCSAHFKLVCLVFLLFSFGVYLYGLCVCVYVYFGCQFQKVFQNQHPKNILFLTGGWNTKVGSEEIPGVTGKFGLAVQNEAEQRLIEFCQENALVIASTLFEQHKRILYIRTSPNSPG